MINLFFILTLVDISKLNVLESFMDEIYKYNV